MAKKAVSDAARIEHNPGEHNQGEHASEQELISRAQAAVSQCNWVVGECACQWTQKYARGRGDGDFGALVGLSADQVFQRRRVWETFADVHGNYPSLKWSHFYVALTWDDAPECLQWAEENQATVAEMKAWRRAARGEDLTVGAESDEWGFEPMGADGTVLFVPSEDVAVKDPGAFGRTDRRDRGAGSGSESGQRTASETVAAVAREGGDSGYAPYRSGAGSPAPRDTESAAAAPRPRLSPEQLITRVSGTLERVNEALTADVLKAFKTLPEKKRNRFLKAVSALGTKAARLM
jgi:hypothetical protein